MPKVINIPYSESTLLLCHQLVLHSHLECRWYFMKPGQWSNLFLGVIEWCKRKIGFPCFQNWCSLEVVSVFSPCVFSIDCRIYFHFWKSFLFTLFWNFWRIDKTVSPVWEHGYDGCVSFLFGCLPKGCGLLQHSKRNCNLWRLFLQNHLVDLRAIVSFA